MSDFDEPAALDPDVAIAPLDDDDHVHDVQQHNNKLEPPEERLLHHHRPNHHMNEDDALPPHPPTMHGIKVSDSPTKQQQQHKIIEPTAEAGTLEESTNLPDNNMINNNNNGTNNANNNNSNNLDTTEEDLLKGDIDDHDDEMIEKIRVDNEVIKSSVPSTQLEHALTDTLTRKDLHILRLTNEIRKLKGFISKRKQTYKRKRKDDNAPRRALSGYNIFIQDRFKRLAKENETALKSTDSDAQLQRVPPANLVAATGNEWKDLPAEEKAKYDERAKTDKARYTDQMAKYQPPDRATNRKRNKTGYNMFFSAHVLRLKQSEQGVPSERGSVARLVGTAWKALSAEEKQYYEREADKHNGMHPVKDDVDEDDDEEAKRQHQHMGDPYAHMHHPDIQYPGAPMHGQPAQHDPRHHGYAPYPTHHMYGQPHAGYDYYGHHQQQQQQPPPAPQQQQQQQHSQRGGQSRSHQGYNQQYPPPQGNPYDRM